MKMNTTRSPKFLRLMALSGLGRAASAGTLELLWLFVMDQSPAGDVGKWSDDEIEAELDWKGEPGALINALVDSRWLDRCQKNRLVVHDWADHLPEFIKKRVKRDNLTIASIVQPCLADGTPCPDNGSQRLPTAHKRREEKGSQGNIIIAEPDMADAPSALGSVSPKPEAQEPEASKRGTKQGKKTVCPERLDPEDRDRLIEWAATNFRLTRPQVVHAWQSVKAWALTNDHRRVDWVMVTQLAIRRGWALDGYKESDDDKYQRELAASPFHRTDGDQLNAN